MKSTRNMAANPFGASTCLGRAIWGLMTSAAIGFSSGALAYKVTAYADGVIGSTTTPGDLSYPYEYDGGVYGSSASVSFTSDPIASVNYSASVFNPVGQLGLNGGGTMVYTFEVSASSFTYVPVDFSGLYSMYQGAAWSKINVSFTIQTVGSGSYSFFQSDFLGNCGASNCLQYTTFNSTRYTSVQKDAFHVEGSFVGTLEMLTGADGIAVGQVQMTAGGFTNVGFSSASSQAFIDPHLEINAAFLAANPGASLTIEPGVGNQISAVPEPGSSALLLAGLATLMLCVRRRAISTTTSTGSGESTRCRTATGA